MTNKRKILVSTFFLISALIMVLWFERSSRLKSTIEIGEVIGQAMLAVLSIAGLLIIERLNEDKKIYYPGIIGLFLVFISSLGELLDEMYLMKAGIMGMEFENILWVGVAFGLMSIAQWTVNHLKVKELHQESESKFYNLAEETPNMIFIFKGGLVVYANKRAEEVLGYSKAEFTSDGFDFLKLVSPESRELVIEKLVQHRDDGDIPPYEFKLQTRGSDEITALHTSKIIDYNGEKAILGIITDITERRQMELKLHHNIQDLEKTKHVLEKKVKELEKWQTLTIGREIKMKELKEEVKNLKKRVKELER